MTFKLLATTVALAVAAQAPAAVLFADNFQTDLSQWNAGSSGVIVAAPGGGNALAFTNTIGGGDLFSASSIASPSGTYHISFEYLGTCTQGASCGGFLGFNNPGETWLSGSGPYGNPHPIVETGSWQTISFDFTSATPITLKLEDWNGATDGPTPLNAYFRNLVITGSVPEPATWGLMIAGFAIVGVAARRRVASAA